MADMLDLLITEDYFLDSYILGLDYLTILPNHLLLEILRFLGKSARKIRNIGRCNLFGSAYGNLQTVSTVVPIH